MTGFETCCPQCGLQALEGTASNPQCGSQALEDTACCPQGGSQTLRTQWILPLSSKTGHRRVPTLILEGLGLALGSRGRDRETQHPGTQAVLGSPYHTSFTSCCLVLQTH